MLRQISQTVIAVIFIASFSTNVINGTAPISFLTASEKCSAPGTAREAIKQSAAVFVGEITKINELENSKNLEFSVMCK